MPTPSKKGTATGSKAVSMDPDDFVATGLPGDFDGKISECRAVVWNYDNGNGNGPKTTTDEEGNEVPLFTLAVRTTIEKSDGETVVNWWSAGDPDHFAPSLDGENPAEVQEDGTSEGIYFIPTGQKTALGKGTNYAQALRALRDAGYSGAFSPDVRFLEGVGGHWDRVPPEKRAGVVPREGDGNRKQNDILVVTAYNPNYSAGKAAPAAKKPAAKPAPAAPAKAVVKTGPTAVPNKPAQTATTSGGDLDEKLQAIVMANLPEDGTAVKKGSFAAKVMKSTELTQQEKSKGVSRIASNDFLDAGMNQEPPLWLFDAEAGEVSAFIAEE